MSEDPHKYCRSGCHCGCLYNADEPPHSLSYSAGSTDADAARLLRDVIGRDLEKRRKFGMYQDQIDDLWRVVDYLESNSKMMDARKD